jgi:hypothetical protein
MQRRLLSLLAVVFVACSTTADTSADTDTGPRPYGKHTCTGAAEAPWIDVTVGSVLACAVASGGCTRCWGYDVAHPSDTATRGVSALDYIQPEPTVKFDSIHMFKGFEPDGRPGAIGLDPLGFAHGWSDGGHTTLSTQFATLTVGPYQSCGADLEGESTCIGQETGFPWGEPIGRIQSWRMSQSLWGVLGADGTIWLHSHASADLDPSVTVRWPGPYVAFDLAMIPTAAVCAVKTSGELSCWNPSDKVLDAPALTGVPEGTFTDVCVTEEGSACALDEAGYPVCWGEIDDEPTEALQTMSCGKASVCGITLDGQLRCWGACEFSYRTAVIRRRLAARRATSGTA